jgi:hypothetical protein
VWCFTPPGGPVDLAKRYASGRSRRRCRSLKVGVAGKPSSAAPGLKSPFVFASIRVRMPLF